MSDPHYFDPVTGARHALDEARWCSDARTPLMISPLPGISPDDIDRRERSLWRYRAALPGAVTRPVSMGEGGTPMVERAWGGLRPHFKLEWFNPTCSFKDRGAAVMLSWLRQIGIGAIAEDSSGNGGAAIAAYGAAAGMGVTIFAPAYTSSAKVAQIRAFGADVRLVQGGRARTPRPPRSRPPSGSSMPATTGSLSSSRAPSPSPTRCGRTSVSRRRTTW